MDASVETVGVLGGTFDPIHLGHLRLADEVRQLLALPRVLLLPTAVPPHKSPGKLSAPHHREEMVRLAVEDREGTELCRLELKRDRVSFTIDTLRSLREGPPPRRPVFVLGTDALLQIESWRDHESLLSEFDLAVIDRPGLELSRIRRRLIPSVAGRLVRLAEHEGAPGRGIAGLQPGRGGRIFQLPVAPISISSSAIRELAAAGRSLAGLVPPAVAGVYSAYGSVPTGDIALTKDVPPEIVHAVEAALDKKAEDPAVLDLRGLSDVTDFFIIAHGTSDRQVLAIADSIAERLHAALKRNPSHVEGKRKAEWILMDYVDFVVHIFVEDKRNFYRLERLWGDAPRLELPSAAGRQEPSRSSSSRSRSG